MKRAKEVGSGLKAATIALALLQAGSALSWPLRAEANEKEKQVETTQTGFYCNIKALTPAERTHHHANTEKLAAKRTQIVEIDKGYEFQYNPTEVSLAEVADWVTLESKCCPFFDFHIDLENEGKLVCLRLTGREGIKAFIRAEFNLQ